MRSKYEKHLAYYELRDEFRKTKHCALCSLERKALHQFFDGLLYEKVTDPGIRGELVRSQGFCPRHAHVLVGFGDGLGTAILYYDQVQLRMKALQGMVSKPRKSHRSQESSAKGRGQCPACRIEKQVRAGHARTLLQGLNEPEMVEAFSSSTGLCFPHFSLVVNEAKESETRSILLCVQTGKLEKLIAHLKEFMDKHDYRRTSEGFTEEKDSWLRAVDLVSGLKNVF